MSMKSPSNISAPSARSCSERSSILWTKARTGIPRLSSILDTCRPVLPCLPPAAEVTRTGFAMGPPCTFCLVLVPYGTSCFEAMVPTGTESRRIMPTQATAKQRQPRSDETPARQRIVEAAFSAFMESGFAAASTLEIATPAPVSKRELYALVGSKQAILRAFIPQHAHPLQIPT